MGISTKKRWLSNCTTPEVKEAYELVRFSNLSPKKRASIIRRKQFWNLNQDKTDYLVDEVKKDTARRLIRMGLSDEQILDVTDFPLDEIRMLRESPSQVLTVGV